MASMRLVRFDPEPDANAPTRWQVGYDVEFGDGTTRHHVVTVFASVLVATDRASVLVATDRASVLVAARDQMMAGIRLLDGPVPDFFDVLADRLEGTP